MSANVSRMMWLGELSAHCHSLNPGIAYLLLVKMLADRSVIVAEANEVLDTSGLKRRGYELPEITECAGD